MPKLLQQRDNLLLLNSSHKYAGPDRAEPKARRRGMSKQRRCLRLISHAYVATGWANPNASVASADIINQVDQRLRHASRGVPLQPLLHFGCRPALVESPAQRDGAESVDTGSATRLLISQDP
jgi:hypothetical protein